MNYWFGTEYHQIGPFETAEKAARALLDSKMTGAIRESGAGDLEFAFYSIGHGSYFSERELALDPQRHGFERLYRDCRVYRVVPVVKGSHHCPPEPTAEQIEAWVAGDILLVHPEETVIDPRQQKMPPLGNKTVDPLSPAMIAHAMIDFTRPIGIETERFSVKSLQSPQVLPRPEPSPWTRDKLELALLEALCLGDTRLVAFARELAPERFDEEIARLADKTRTRSDDPLYKEAARLTAYVWGKMVRR